MEKYQDEFVDFLLEEDALRFGDFTTKSGRRSPYFINTGQFFEARSLRCLAGFYAKHIMRHFDDFTCLYGPAYKGIPLVVATSLILENDFGKNVSYVFNRKEEKLRGEGGHLVGKPLKERDRILILDDVITAGLSIRESMNLLRQTSSPHLVGIVVSVDRMERSDLNRETIFNLKESEIKIRPLVTLDEIFARVRKRGILSPSQWEKIQMYRDRYGVERKGKG